MEGTREAVDDQNSGWLQVKKVMLSVINLCGLVLGDMVYACLFLERIKYFFF